MKKFSIFLCFAVICATLFGTSVFAQTYGDLPEFPNPGTAYNSAWILYLDASGDYVLKDFRETNSDNWVRFDAVSNNDDLTYSVVATCLDYHEVYTYKLVDGVWVQQGSKMPFSPNQNNTITLDLNTVKYTDIPIKDINTGEVLFPEPPLPTLQEVVTEALTNLQMETHGTMKILTVCGIGLLVSLLGLVILPKVLYRFL